MPQSYYPILPHPTESKILLTQGPEGWTLPCVELQSGFMAYISSISEQIRERYGLSITVLRCIRVHAEGEGEARNVYAIFACENHGDDVTPPPDCAWTDKASLPDMLGIPSPIRVALEAWFAEAENQESISSLRPGWALPGWLDETTEWIHQALSTQGITPTGPVEQLKTWSISCLLRLSTTAGNVYAKAVPSVFATEPRLTAALAKHFPGQTAEVLAVDETRNSLLLRELSGKSLRDAEQQEPEAGFYTNALRQFSALQFACIGQEERLTEWGCRNRPLSQLPADITELLTELESPEMRTVYGLTEEDANTLIRGVPGKVSTLCQELTVFGLPETLLHGDLHGGNVWVTGEGTNRSIVFFDWSDGAIAHPFFDLVTFLPTPDASDEAAMTRYIGNRDAYLEAWTTYLPQEDLVRAFTVAQKLAPAYHAISYRYIAQATEPAAQWELSSAVGYYLKKILD